MATMEENIRKAMRELGLDPDANLGNEDTKPVKTPSKLEESKPVKPVETVKKTAEKKPTDKLVVHKNLEPRQEVAESDTIPQSIFMKIEGNRMVLLIPEGLTLDKRVIGGTTYNTVAVKVPDFGGKLYEMPLLNTDESKSVRVETKTISKAIKRIPIISEPEDKSDDTDDDYIKDLMKEKARLDSEIKAARASNDEDLVNDLRKQRRLVRNKINKAMEE